MKHLHCDKKSVKKRTSVGHIPTNNRTLRWR